MPGTIIFKPIEANLNSSGDLLSKADPYCQFTIDGQKIKGQSSKSGGKHPIWDDTITIPASSQPVCLVELKDKDLLKDDKLGSFEIDLREIESQGRLKKWYPIFLKDKPAGEILMEAVFSPQGGFSQGLPSQGMGMGMPIQRQGMPIQNQGMGMPIQNQGLGMQQQGLGMPIQTHGTTMHSQGMMGAPITQETVVTKETHIIEMPPMMSQPMGQPMMQQSAMLPDYGFTDSALLQTGMAESISEQYAREALIRGVDPLGTQHFAAPMTESYGLHNLLPQSMPLGGANIPSQTGQYLPGQQGLGQSLPGQGLTQSLPGQYLPGQQIPGQQLPGQQLPGQQILGQQIPGQQIPQNIKPNQF